MKFTKDEGIIIKAVNVGEADKILTLFTRGHGKLRLKAKGIRRITSRRSGSLEIFNNIRFSAASGKQTDVLTEVEIIDSYSGLRTDLTRVAIAYHYCELVDRLMPDHEENTKVFHLIKQSLMRLAGIKAFDISPLRKEVINFEVELLRDLGFGLPTPPTQQNLINHIETILERPLKSRQILLQIASHT